MQESENLLGKALQIIEEADKKGVQVRLLGGLAFAYLTRNARRKELERKHDDIDLAAIRSQAGKLKDILIGMGLKPNNVFNALHGYERLQFFYGSAKVDVFLDYFRMCHFLDLRSRIVGSRTTLPPSDLLLTKLQIHEINEKDMKDVILLLSNLKFGNADSEDMIDAGYIANLLSKDWGFYKTVTDNIEKTREYLHGLAIDQNTRNKVMEELDYLENAILQKPKSASWKLRAKIGERVRWYMLPEEVEAQPVSETGKEQQINYEYMTFAEIDSLAKNMAKRISKKYGRPSGIVYIERGGMVFGNLLAKYLNVKTLAGIQAMAYKGAGKMGRVKLMPSYIDIGTDGYLLLADDIVDTGETMRQVVRLLGKKYRRIVKATLAFKPRSKIVPDIYGKKVDNTTWLVFDYEETEAMKSGNGKTHTFMAEEEASKIRKNSKKYEKVKEACKEAAAKISRKGRPEAIIYLADSTALEARLLSDYLGVKRVLGVELSKEFESVIGELIGDAHLRRHILIVAPSIRTAYKIEKMVKAKIKPMQISRAIL
ncbi:MAG: phosphoribosyltransferase [Candidatus Micrarchaeia archaeon]